MIHQYRLNGYNIVLDVNSGAVHLMDDLSFDLLDMLGDPIPESCPGEAFDRFTPQYARRRSRTPSGSCSRSRKRTSSARATIMTSSQSS